MSESRICKVTAQVMIYNDHERRWFHAGEGGANCHSTISILTNEQNGASRIVAQKADESREVTVNMNIVKSLKYHQATKTFHQWRDHKTVYGLNFTSEEFAEHFATVLLDILERLRQPVVMQAPPSYEPDPRVQVQQQPQQPVVSSAVHNPMVQPAGGGSGGPYNQSTSGLGSHYSNGHGSQRSGEGFGGAGREHSNSSPTINRDFKVTPEGDGMRGYNGGAMQHGAGLQGHASQPQQIMQQFSDRRDLSDNQPNGYHPDTTRQEAYSADSISKAVEKVQISTPPAVPAGGPPAPPPPPPPPPAGGSGPAAKGDKKPMPVSLQEQLNRNNRANLRPANAAPAPAVKSSSGGGGNFLDELKRRQAAKNGGGAEPPSARPVGVVPKPSTASSVPAWKQNSNSNYNKQSSSGSPSTSHHNLASKNVASPSPDSPGSGLSSQALEKLKNELRRELTEDFRRIIREELKAFYTDKLH